MHNNILTISRPNDAPELNVLPQFDGAAALDPGRVEIGATQTAKQPNLAQEVVAAAEVDRGGSLLNTKIRKLLSSSAMHKAADNIFFCLTLFTPFYQR